MGVTLFASLTPGAFLKLAKDDEDGDGKTGEMQMLEISRQELQRSATEKVQNLPPMLQSFVIFWNYYVYDTVATGCRFVHLVVVFLPVILAAPAVWLGRRIEGRRGTRTGTLWWYNFLVKSMERAGPTFIKVGRPMSFA